MTEEEIKEVVEVLQSLLDSLGRVDREPAEMTVLLKAIEGVSEEQAKRSCTAGEAFATHAYVYE